MPTSVPAVEVTGQHLKTVWRKGGAVDQVAIGAPVEGGELDGRSAGANHFESVGNDFFADAVSGNNGDALVGSHGKILAFSTPLAVSCQPSAKPPSLRWLNAER